MATTICVSTKKITNFMAVATDLIVPEMKCAVPEGFS